MLLHGGQSSLEKTVPFFLMAKTSYSNFFPFRIFWTCQGRRHMICVCISFQINAGFGTLNTNFSPLRTAMVSKCPSQMSGPCSGLGTLVGRGGGGGGGAPDLVPAVGGMFVGEVTSLKGYSTEIILQCHWRSSWI